MMNSVKFFTSLLLLAGFVFSNPAGAFTLAGASITGGWDKKELVFQVNESSCTALGITADKLNTAIDAAVDLWNSAPTTSIKLKRGSVITTTGASDPPSIFCINNMSSPDAVVGQGAIASTLGGKPATGYLQLNGDSTRNAYFGNTSAVQAAIVLAHEMGHVMGLGHTGKSAALMYYDISVKASLSLSQDDIDGLTWLNPRNEPGSGFMGCGTLNTRGTQGKGGDGNSTQLFITWACMILLFRLVTRKSSRSRQVGIS